MIMQQTLRIDGEAHSAARTRLVQMTMPYWALGRHMDLAEELVGAHF
jgi:hypothetical protein